jgi:hypothetical protein
MGKRGPKGKPAILKVVAGTDRPDRRRETLVKTLAGDCAKPTWLKGRAEKLWFEKAATYKARGQSVVGCESALAQYVSLEAALIEQFAKKVVPPTSQVNAYRVFAAEFFDTPASQIGSIQKQKGGKFASNGQRPATVSPPDPAKAGADA